MPLNMTQELATILLVETLRVGAAVLLVAGAALVASAILTQTMADKSKYPDGDPFAGFGFVGAVGLGIGAMCTSIPMWTTFRAIRVWQRAIPPRDLHYQRPVTVTEGEPANIVPSIADAGRPLAQYSIVAGRLPSGLKIDKRKGSIAGLPRLKQGDMSPGAHEAVFHVTVLANNLKGSCRTTIAVTVRRAGAAGRVPARSEMSGGVWDYRESEAGSPAGAAAEPDRDGSRPNQVAWADGGNITETVIMTAEEGSEEEAGARGVDPHGVCVAGADPHGRAAGVEVEMAMTKPSIEVDV